MEEIKHIILEGKCMWAHIHQATEDFNRKQIWCIDIEVSDPQISKLKAAGMHANKKIKEEDGVKYITITRPVVSSRGKDMRSVAVVGKDMMPFTKEVGNGSRVKVKIALIPFNNQYGVGVVLMLEAVQVLDHIEVEYESPTEGFVDETKAKEGDDDLPF